MTAPENQLQAAHSTEENGPTIFISAAEPSADLHGSSLIRAAKILNPKTRFVGVAGPKMQAAGCESIFDMTRHAAMLLNAVGAAGKAWRMLRTAEQCMQQRPFDAAVVIDSPTLHLPLAARANKLGIPVLYYIAPQLWAWGKHRIFKLRHIVQHVAAILPFEEPFFRNDGVNVTFVGHPLADAVRLSVQQPEDLERIRKGGSPVIALLPGSRKHVVEKVLPGQLEVARQIRSSFPNAAFVVSVAGPHLASLVQGCIEASGVRVGVETNAHHSLIQASDLVLVASGTTTLEVAFYEKPMIVMYNASRAMFNLLGRWIVRIPYYSLPNILAGRQIVPEFMPYYTSTAPIASAAISLLNSPARRDAMSRDLAKIVAPLRNRNASMNTAELLLEMAQPDHH